MHIVIVSSVAVPGSLTKLLDGCGVQYSMCHDIAMLPAHILRDHPHLLLCHCLPDDVLTQVRALKDAQFPTLQLFAISQNGSALDRLIALQNGIAQYYLQPVSYIRLVYDIGSVQYSAERYTVVQRGPFKVDLSNQSISYHDHQLTLSKKQFALLNLLISRSNQVVSRVQIWESVWGLEQYPLANCIDALICRIRQRIPRSFSGKIEQMYGIGYRLIV